MKLITYWEIMKINCDYCGLVFNRKPSSIRAKNYCSKKCRHNDKYAFCKCGHCGANFEKAKNTILGRTFCSRKCAASFTSPRMSEMNRQLNPSRMVQATKEKLRSFRLGKGKGTGYAKIYGRHEGEAEEKEIELVDVSLKDLVVAFKRVYDEAAKRERVVPIEAEEVSLEDRIIEIKRMLAGRGDGVPFEDIFLRKTRLEIVVTFLAILELTKQRFIKITQGRRFESILIFARKIYENEFAAAAE